MDLTELLRIADAGYRRAARDGGVLRLINEETGEEDTDGDSFAHGIVTELREGVEGEGAVETLESAIEAMEDLRSLLNGVLDALCDALRRYLND